MSGARAARTMAVRAMGEGAVLVRLGDTIDEATSARVLALDAALARASPAGMTETVPAYATLLVAFDPLVTDHAAIIRAIDAIGDAADGAVAPNEHVLPVCYDSPHAPDLDAVAQRTGLTRAAVIAAHLAGAYRVYMIGFAPGYAYLGGVPAALQLPRKPAAERGHPAGSVLIAGPQALVTTLDMPTGWWVIGRSPARLLDTTGDMPIALRPGDRVRFEQIDGDAFAQASR